MNIAQAASSQIMQPQPRLLGSTGDIWGLSELAKPRIGGTIVIPGLPAPLSIATVGILLAGIVGVIMLKKKRIL